MEIEITSARAWNDPMTLLVLVPFHVALALAIATTLLRGLMWTRAARALRRALLTGTRVRGAAVVLRGIVRSMAPGAVVARTRVLEYETWGDDRRRREWSERARRSEGEAFEIVCADGGSVRADPQHPVVLGAPLGREEKRQDGGRVLEASLEDGREVFVIGALASDGTLVPPARRSAVLVLVESPARRARAWARFHAKALATITAVILVVAGTGAALAAPLSLHGVTVDATVLDLEEVQHESGGSPTDTVTRYRVIARGRLPTGEEVLLSDDLRQRSYLALHEGDRVRFTVWPSHPSWHYVGTTPTIAPLWLALALMLVSAGGLAIAILHHRTRRWWESSATDRALLSVAARL